MDIANLIGIILSSMNCNVIIKDSFTSQLEEVEACEPDIIIVDYWLTNGTADKFIPKVKNNVKLESTPILLISAVNNLSTIAKDLNVDGFIPKPFDIIHFQNVVQNMLPKHN